MTRPWTGRLLRADQVIVIEADGRERVVSQREFGKPKKERRAGVCPVCFGSGTDHHPFCRWIAGELRSHFSAWHMHDWSQQEWEGLGDAEEDDYSEDSFA